VTLISGSWLASPVVRRMRPHGGARQPGTATIASRVAGATTTAIALLVLAQAGVLVAMPALVDTGFLGRLELPAEQKVLVHVPVALAALVMVGAISLIVARTRSGVPNSTRIHQTLLVIGSFVLVIQLALWRLIGWGFG
jgi:hypothetical protein